ncbi:glycosyltransferase family 2 protein, partial [Gaiella sp.]|uniref:glycosyltransferase family 2 protein n=1 Tax=Gaiella sp. TaxID=2663207 RepID=UPI0032661A3D
ETIVVVDGGSTDGTAELARAAGALVVLEPRRGYGRACLEGSRATDAEILVFLDGDGSDDPAAIESLVEPIRSGRAALVLGARVDPERGAQHGHQRLGNALVSLLVRLCYGTRIHDIPPMRAIRRDALEQLGMAELTYGWPTEMIVKAARQGLPIIEIPVPSRARRGGESKVSGKLGPSIRAGTRMLHVVARYG